jgi:hypothetical protein
MIHVKQRPERKEDERLREICHKPLVVRLQDRVPIRIPRSMINEVDRIVRDYPELGYNRQQFVESGLREKIEHIILLESASSSRAPMTLRSHVRIPHRSHFEG